MKLPERKYELVLMSLLVSTTSVADDLTTPNAFTAGTPARAAEVNGNFTAVEASVDDNAADIATNAIGIQSLNTSLAALGGGGTGLSVLFYSPTPAGDVCEFTHMPSQRKYWWSSGGQSVYMSSYQNGELGLLLRDVLTVEDSRAALIDLMIRIGNLPLVVDDFLDPATGELVCTNEKLLSLL